MKVISIIGSPRVQGAGTRISTAFTDQAAKLGADVKVFRLNDMNFSGCQGCEGCHTKSDKCIIEDDLTEVLDSIFDADILVFSAPVYYGDTSGQFKLFMDRTWSYVIPRYMVDPVKGCKLPRGKKALFILTQGFPEAAHKDVIARYKDIFRMYGFDTKIIRAANSINTRNYEFKTEQDKAAKVAQDWIELLTKKDEEGETE